MKRSRIYFGIIGTLFLLGSTSLIIASCTKNNIESGAARTDTWNYLANTQEEYLNKNSVSILTTVTPNGTWLKNYLNSFNNNAIDIDNTDTIFVKNVFSALLGIIDDPTNGLNRTTASLGTGWILDYSPNSANSNLVNYYIATNIHVLDTSWKWDLGVNGTNDIITINVPASKETSSQINFYLSQPQGSTKDASERQDVLVNTSNNAWYKTNTNASNFETNVLPIGAISPTGSEITTSGFPYDFTMTYETSTSKNTYFFYKEDNQYKFSINSYNYNNTLLTSDLAVLKVSENVSNMTTTSSSSLIKKIYQNMNAMFTTSTNNDETKVNSSYIAKLNKLISLAEQNKKDSNEFKELFLFEDSNKNLSTGISITGFPGNSVDDKWYSSTNSNTINSNLANKNGSSLASSRPTIEYNYNGQFSYNEYDYTKDWLLRNVNLGGGSSGSQAITSDYKVLGIYWGVLTNNLLRTKDGIITTLYSEKDSQSLIYRYLRYINNNDSNSQLLRLFRAMNEM